METISDLYRENKEFFTSRKLQNVIPLCGNGSLTDGTSSSIEFRSFLEIIPSDLLIRFAKDCLTESFKDSGLALQDIINQIGRRLNYNVEYGLYRGRKNLIGYDGIWTGKDGYKLIVEVKTTDAYRINLDTLSIYKDKLQERGAISKDSSILIIVGREDTGDLEAQIRGSKHAWSIRLISIDAIIDLLNMRETVNDSRILLQINEVLKPLEFTRLDKLVKLLFLTSQDQAENENIEEIEVQAGMGAIDVLNEMPIIDGFEEKEKKAPMNYHLRCIDKISAGSYKSYVKLSRSTYESSDKKTGITLSVSKTYITGRSIAYWYSFHPYQEEFLKDYSNCYACFGCGDENSIVVFPAAEFLKLKNCFTTTTTKGNKMYWHVWIYKKDNNFELSLSKTDGQKRINIDKYLNAFK